MGLSIDLPGPMLTPVAKLVLGTLATLHVSSPAFQHGRSIPRRFSCEGEDVAPELRWDGAPEGTRSFALLVEDPDAPGGTFVHWVVYDLPAEVRGLGEGKLPSGARQGRNGFGKSHYGGPCPPPGPAHHYHFRLFALDRPLDLPAGATDAELRRAMEGHVLGTGELVGTFGR